MDLRKGTARFNRWAFSRCADCGQGFSWGERVVKIGIPRNGENAGPHFFRGEKNVLHEFCANRPRAVSIGSISASMFE